jgi:hypothetical protein
VLYCVPPSRSLSEHSAMSLKRWFGAAGLLHVVSACRSSFPQYQARCPLQGIVKSPLCCARARYLLSTTGWVMVHAVGSLVMPSSSEHFGPEEADLIIARRHPPMVPTTRQRYISLPTYLPACLKFCRQMYAPTSAVRVCRACEPKCTSARCDVRSGCIGVHPTATRWRRPSQYRCRDILALSGSMFDRRLLYGKPWPGSWQ